MNRIEQSGVLTPQVWFSTPIWSQRVVDHVRINTELMSGLRRLEETEGNISRSNVGGWHSSDQIHLDGAFSEITRLIGNTCVSCARFLDFDFSRFNLSITHMWFNKNGPGAFNKAHIHPNAILSGAYYVQTPDMCGNIEFYDPIPARSMIVFPVTSEKPAGAQAIEYKAEEGLLLVFPSWLQHSVQPNRSDNFRISISFNVGFQPVRTKVPPH